MVSDKWKVYDREYAGVMELLGDDPGEYQAPLCEIDTMPQIFDHIVVSGRAYSICMISPKHRRVAARALAMGQEHDIEFTSNAVCPHCGHEDHDCFEWSSDEGEHDCGHCGLPFKYTREVSITYSTEKIGNSYKKPIAEV